MKLTDDELASLLARSGLRINQPYNPKQSYRKDEYIFTQCLTCGTEAHYRLKYILEKRADTCRACYWRNWYNNADDYRQSTTEPLTKSNTSQNGPISQAAEACWSDAKALAASHGYDLVNLLHSSFPGNDVLVVRCQACGRQIAQRPCDVEFGCTCNKSKLKGPGITFGSEATEIDTPLESRNIAPRTPGAKGFEQWMERLGSDEVVNEYRRTKGKMCADYPELMAAWYDVSDPFSTSATASSRLHLICQHGHHPYQTPFSFLTNGCMVCRGLKTRSDPHKEYLDATNPELAAEWDIALDGNKYTPQNVGSGSRRKVQWRCIACGGTWTDTVRNRELRMNNRCPHCSKIMGSLAWKHPGIARFWSPSNPISPWNTKPFGTLDFKPEWKCLKNPDHIWREGVQSVIKNKGRCPHCE